jgi:hypothetical protein
MCDNHEHLHRNDLGRRNFLKVTGPRRPRSGLPALVFSRVLHALMR